MKLRMLVVAAGILAFPVITHAQQDTTKKMADTTKKMADTTKKMEKMEMKKPVRTRKAAAKAEKMEGMKAEKGEKMEAMAKGGDCPRGCPTSKGAAGLTGVQFLALQQELRDRGCGNTHVTGVLDGVTRHAIATCAKQLSVANNAGAVLVAMNIGYSESDVTAPKTSG
jgi:hypothetical protein